MADREHEEWLADERARKAAAKANHKSPPVPPNTSDEEKREPPEDNLNERVWWRGEA